MAITEEERKQIRAYNIGSLLSMHEPKLLERIIKSNKNHGFVKMMAAAKDHLEFYQGIPRKDHTREYKNGFYNSRALAEQNPVLLDRLLTTKTLHKDFLKGLKDGKTEYEISHVKSKLNSEPKPVAKNEQADYIKGFNQGYLLSSKQHSDIIQSVADTQKRWSPYIQGLQAGKTQYEKEQELSKSQPKKPANPEKDRLSDKDYYRLSTNIENLKDNAEEKEQVLNTPDNPIPEPENNHPENPGYVDLSNYIPDWLREDGERDKNTPDGPEKDQDQDIEPEL